MIVSNIKKFYEEELGHILLIIPDTTNLGKDPANNIREMELLLKLLLGCAVLCPQQEILQKKITDLFRDRPIQEHVMVDYIKQVTIYPGIVLTQNMIENYGTPGVFEEVKKLYNERNIYREKCRNTPGIDDLCGEKNIKNKITNSEYEENHHNAVTLAELRSQLRKKKQECDEYKESLDECQSEIDKIKETICKLKHENQELIHEARIAKSYRDELDAVMERAERADRLELEVSRYRAKLTDIEFYKSTIEQLRDDKKTLEENRDMLEKQLIASRSRADKVLELEAQLIDYKQILNDVALERDADKEKYHEVIEENLQLHKLKKAADDEAAKAAAGSISETDELIDYDNRLSEQLTNNAQTRALKLELENRRLTALVDSLKENTFHESSTRLLELEKEKKKMSIKIESLTDNNDRLVQQNTDLELVCKQALEENKKLQNTLKNQRTSFERQQQDYQTQQLKIVEFEKNYEIAIKEKQRVQSLLESVRKRADELERSLDMSNQKIEELKILDDKIIIYNKKCMEMEEKIIILEKDKESGLREVHKCRELIEEKDVALDKATNSIEVLEKKLSELSREIENSVSQIIRLQEIEKTSKELDSQAAIDKETMETLKSNLIAEKLNTQQLQTIFEKLGLTVDSLLNLTDDNIIDTLVNIPELSQYINKLIANIESSQKSLETSLTNIENYEDTPINKNLRETIETMKKEMENIQIKLITSQSTGENLLEEQAKLQVSITTLQSKNTSLNSQHTALQLANSQLVAEKEELLKNRDIQQRTHQQLLHDQVTLQSLHEQLNNEYENLLQERETLKTNLRDAKNVARTLKESCELFETKNKQLISEQEIAASNVKSLNNLRGEHSKLKVFNS